MELIKQKMLQDGISPEEIQEFFTTVETSSTDTKNNRLSLKKLSENDNIVVEESVEKHRHVRRRSSVKVEMLESYREMMSPHISIENPIRAAAMLSAKHKIAPLRNKTESLDQKGTSTSGDQRKNSHESQNSASVSKNGIKKATSFQVKKTKMVNLSKFIY